MIQDLHRIVQLIEGEWRNTRVLVVGDLMLDRYIWGEVERISPEAPVPVVRCGHRTERPGGAANVAMNLVGLGAGATLFGFCGDDADALVLEKSLREAGVEIALTAVSTHPTTSKLRVLSGKQQMLRLDTEQTSGYPAEAYADLIGKVDAALATAHAVVLSDYAKGVLTEEVCQQVIRAASRRGIPVLVDPKQRDFTRYRGATTICPNLTELSTAVGVPLQNLDALLAAGQALVSQLDLQCLIATMSEKGIAVLREHSRFVAPPRGAPGFRCFRRRRHGDSTVALAAASRLEMETAAQLANVTAGIVVGKVGTVPVERGELLSSLMPEIELACAGKGPHSGTIEAACGSSAFGRRKRGLHQWLL